MSKARLKAASCGQVFEGVEKMTEDGQKSAFLAVF